MGVYLYPNNTETELKNAYIGEPTYEPWIYHKSDLWLISLSSDWSNWITIADKNLWAVNVNDYGNFFQWGNNYWFWLSSPWQHNWTVDTTGYWPWNYYSSSTFLTWNRDWSNPSNANLWGDTTDTLEARQWPCNVGYHIPSVTEMTNFIDLTKSLWAVSGWAWLVNYLKMPYWWYITNDGWGYWLAGSYWFYWTSTWNWSYWKFLQFDSGNLWYWSGQERWKTMWAKIRPFKNEAIIPDNTRTVLYQPN